MNLDELRRLEWRSQLVRVRGAAAPGGCGWVNIVTDADDLLLLADLRSREPEEVKGYITAEEFRVRYGPIA